MREEVKTAEQDALDVLVNLFDWADSLDSQPTTGSSLTMRNLRMLWSTSSLLSPRR